MAMIGLFLVIYKRFSSFLANVGASGTQPCWQHLFDCAVHERAFHNSPFYWLQK
jgi:hypothetical protein